MCLFQHEPYVILLPSDLTDIKNQTFTDYNPVVSYNFCSSTTYANMHGGSFDGTARNHVLTCPQLNKIDRPNRPNGILDKQIHSTPFNSTKPTQPPNGPNRPNGILNEDINSAPFNKTNNPTGPT